jgi:hypothetical protein
VYLSIIWNRERTEGNKMSGLISEDLFVLREAVRIGVESALLEVVTELAAALTPENKDAPEVLKSKEDEQSGEHNLSSAPCCNTPADTLKDNPESHRSLLDCLKEILHSLKERNKLRGFRLEGMCQPESGNIDVSISSEYSLERLFDMSAYLTEFPQPPVIDQ